MFAREKEGRHKGFLAKFERVKRSIGTQRYLLKGKAFFSFFILSFTRRVSGLALFQNRLHKIRIKHLQRLIRIPNTVANPSLPEPQSVRVCITYRCNRSCSFCHAEKQRQEFPEDMSVKDFEFLAGWAKSQGIEVLRFLGGEPTMHPEFKTLLEIIKKHALIISISTNGLFDPELASSFNKSFIERIGFSYPQDPLEKQDMEKFLQNFKNVTAKKNRMELSWVIRPDGDDWRKVIDFAKMFKRKVRVRFTMLMPNSQGEFDSKEIKDAIPRLGRQIVSIAKYAYKNNIMFFFYRPLLLCMFTQEEIRFLRSINPFLFYTRCPIGLRGHYDVDLRMAINPDLSCYPCPPLPFPGIKITPETTLETINQFFQPLIRQLIREPLMEACRTCVYFDNFLNKLESGPQDLADRLVCQGGCHRYRAMEALGLKLKTAQNRP